MYKELVGKKYSQLSDFYKGKIISQGRFCREEKETNQFLGYEAKDFEGDIIYQETKKVSHKVVKNFKY